MSQFFEAGQHRGRVVRWALVKAKNENKTPQFALTFLPLGRIDPNGGELLPCPNLERTIFRSVTDNTAAWLLRDLKALFDYPHERFGPLDPENAEAYDFHDREFDAVLYFEEFDGKTREKWNFVGEGFTGDPLSAAEVRKLDALYGAGKPKRAKKSKEEARQNTERAGQPVQI